MSSLTSQPDQSSEVDRVRDFYVRTRRHDEQVLGRETPIVHLGERSDFDLHDEQQAQAYEACRYSAEATEELGRAAGRRLFSIPVPWKAS